MQEESERRLHKATRIYDKRLELGHELVRLAENVFWETLDVGALPTEEIPEVEKCGWPEYGKFSTFLKENGVYLDPAVYAAADEMNKCICGVHAEVDNVVRESRPFRFSQFGEIFSLREKLMKEIKESALV